MGCSCSLAEEEDDDEDSAVDPWPWLAVTAPLPCIAGVNVEERETAGVGGTPRVVSAGGGTVLLPRDVEGVAPPVEVEEAPALAGFSLVLDLRFRR